MSFSFKCLQFSENVTKLTVDSVGRIKSNIDGALKALKVASLYWEELKGCGSPYNYKKTIVILHKTMKTVASVSCTIKNVSLEQKFTRPSIEEISSQVDSLFVNTKNLLDGVEVLVDTCESLGKVSETPIEEDLNTQETNAMTELLEMEMFLNVAVDDVERTARMLLKEQGHSCI